MAYAIISLGGKQYRVREGEKLNVDRLAHADGATFNPKVLLLGGDGATDLSPKDVSVTVRVVGPLLGPKIRIGKYKQRTGHHKHTGFRASLTQIQIESIGAKAKVVAKPKAEAAVVEEKPKAAAKPKAPPKPKAETAAKPKAPAKPKAAAKPKAEAKPTAAKKAPARKPAAKKQEEES